MDNEKPNLPESLFPKEEIFNGGKVIINYLPERLEGLEIETIGWEKLDEERARRVGGFDLLDDLRYALRDITIDTFGKVKAKIMNTTMGLYNRFHRAETEEDIKNLELSMPVGGCAILITTEPDGSNRMVVQYRVDKNEYQDTAGASAGGIMKMQFNDSGYPKPVQEVYREHIASRLSLGVSDSARHRRHHVGQCPGRLGRSDPSTLQYYGQKASARSLAGPYHRVWIYHPPRCHFGALAS